MGGEGAFEIGGGCELGLNALGIHGNPSNFTVLAPTKYNRHLPLVFINQT